MPEGKEELRLLVVDDEALARDLVRQVLAPVEDVRIVGQCGDGLTAVQEIGRLRPDLVLLDIQMPEVSGFDVLERVGPDAMPEVIFVTAHEEHTLRAFEVHALDYVLKPIDPERLREAIGHARSRIGARGDVALVERLSALLREAEASSEGGVARSPDRITVRKGDTIRFVDLDDVKWLESARNYVRVHAGDASYLVRSSLKALLRRLNSERFVRIHRSAAVNLDHVEEARSRPGGDYAVALRGGETLRVSRTYADRLLELLH